MPDPSNSKKSVRKPRTSVQIAAVKKTRAQRGAEIRGLLREARDLYRKSARKFIASGRALIRAKKALRALEPDSEWLKFLRQDIRIDVDLAENLMRVGRDRRIARSVNSRNLPRSLSALVALTRVPDDAFEQAIANGPPTAKQVSRFISVPIVHTTRKVTSPYYIPSETKVTQYNPPCVVSSPDREPPSERDQAIAGMHDAGDQYRETAKAFKSELADMGAHVTQALDAALAALTAFEQELAKPPLEGKVVRLRPNASSE